MYYVKTLTISSQISLTVEGDSLQVLAEQKANLGKDEMLNIIKHGAKSIFANKDDDTMELDIDTLLETGEKKTEDEKKKMDDLGESNLRNFTLDTKPEDSVYNFEGEDFR